MSVLSQLQPAKVFEYFERLSSVPHGSGNTKAVSDLCVVMAKELGLVCRQDEANNVVIWKPASPGYEAAEPIIMQGHIDMVCVKTEACPKNMETEPIDLCTDGTWVWADQTSLGGDDGIAAAVIFAILAEKNLPHPALEVILTTDEEIGMDGARALDCSDLKGRKLLNLDSEEEGVFTVSCAGGVRVDLTFPCVWEPCRGESGFRLTLSGLLGGHSGMEINKGRGNANCLMARLLRLALPQFPGLRLGDIRGGNVDNAICPKNDAFVLVPAGMESAFLAFIAETDAMLKNEYAAADPGVNLSCEPVVLAGAASAETTAKLLHALCLLPQGVQEMSASFPGLVQTSLNQGIISMTEQGVTCTFSIRSCIASQKEMMVQKLASLAELAGGTIQTRSSYPGWQFQPESNLRDTVLASYRDLEGKEGRVEAIHGGLECGLFVEKMPGLDAISFGPELHDIHSPEERLGVASVGRLYAMTCEILKRSR